MNPSLSTPKHRITNCRVIPTTVSPTIRDARALQAPQTASEPGANALCISTLLFTPRHPVVPSRRPFLVLADTYDSIQSLLAPYSLTTNIPLQKAYVRIALHRQFRKDAYHPHPRRARRRHAALQARELGQEGGWCRGRVLYRWRCRAWRHLVVHPQVDAPPSCEQAREIDGFGGSGGRVYSVAMD
ncbi:hypothetical protein VC83_06127 [Pseudogymnoascus destructans]|uniref:Uncharacterized protein n=1 Tax=Pseudogymnoascus destructans TaxID=655981 RepID=A0A177AC32_9PEZI|nr:uncharacterized protein VC83_06127 [Pseudogymnoascus destructans]OAF58831.1 hypothetical protein VC83_06127 [Pseudogymnoascus destructans]